MQMECESLIFARLFIYISHGFSLYRHTRLFLYLREQQEQPSQQATPPF